MATLITLAVAIGDPPKPWIAIFVPRWDLPIRTTLSGPSAFEPREPDPEADLLTPLLQEDSFAFEVLDQTADQKAVAELILGHRKSDDDGYSLQLLAKEIGADVVVAPVVLSNGSFSETREEIVFEPT